MLRLSLFVLGSLFLLRVSWKALKNPEVHGFYRFFVFEGILALVLLNYPFWFVHPFSATHILSWLMLGLSIIFIAESLRLLKLHGGKQTRVEMPENLSFENTRYVVDSGLYRLVRHPMYASLLFLGWGAFLKHLTLVNTGLILWVTGFIVASAKVEERENKHYFGSDYAEYMRRSKMFIPWLF